MAVVRSRIVDRIDCVGAQLGATRFLDLGASEDRLRVD